MKLQNFGKFGKIGKWGKIGVKNFRAMRLYTKNYQRFTENLPKSKIGKNSVKLQNFKEKQAKEGKLENNKNINLPNLPKNKEEIKKNIAYLESLLYSLRQDLSFLDDEMREDIILFSNEVLKYVKK